MEITNIKVEGNRITYRANGILSETFKDCLETIHESTYEVQDAGWGEFESHIEIETSKALDFEELPEPQQKTILADHHEFDNQIESPSEQDGDSGLPNPTPKTHHGRADWGVRSKPTKTRQRNSNRALETA